MRQDDLRKNLKIKKIENDGLFNYEEIADYLDIKVGSLYNWLSGSYNLGYEKEKKLYSFLCDLED